MSDIDLAEVARVIFEASRDRFMRPEQCYPAVTALHEAGYLRDPGQPAPYSPYADGRFVP